MLAVYTLDEARALVEAAVATPILILMPVRTMDRTDPVYRHAVSGKVHVTLHDADQLAALNETAGRLGTTLPVHVQLDTGLARGGAMPEEATKLVDSIARTPRLRLGGLMTHFASPCTDAAFTREQARMFREWLEGVKPMVTAAAGSAGAVAAGSRGVWLHAANSCAVFRSAKYHGNLVRAGQSLYGFVGDDFTDRRGEEAGSAPAEGEAPQGPEFAREARELRPAVRWTSSIVQVKEIPEGFPVGYGSTWRAPRATRIALVPVGYADGYARSLSNTGVVGLTGRVWDRIGGAGSAAEGACAAFAPVVGRVSMDQIMLDVTDAPEAARRVGMEVEIVGRDRRAPNALPRLAERAGTITHELMCGISPRVERIYRYPASLGAESVGAVAVRVAPRDGAGEASDGRSSGAAVA
jgi:alanine racemase